MIVYAYQPLTGFGPLITDIHQPKRAVRLIAATRHPCEPGASYMEVFKRNLRTLPPPESITLVVTR